MNRDKNAMERRADDIKRAMDQTNEKSLMAKILAERTYLSERRVWDIYTSRSLSTPNSETTEKSDT